MYPADTGGNKIDTGAYCQGRFLCEKRKKLKRGFYFGPNVTIVTPIHPMLAEERKEILTADGEKKRLCCAKPVHIGNNCWLGASVTICPGVTIGDDCVIGAGSVVTRDIPKGSFAAGVPCKVIRPITEKDSMKYKPEILGDNTIL